MLVARYVDHINDSFFNRVKGQSSNESCCALDLMSDFDYETLLERARDRIPDDISNRSRWTLPAPKIMIEGSNTIFQNFLEVIKHMERDDNHFYQYMLNELGTSGSRDGPRARFKGRIPPKRIKKTIVNYVNSFVKCSQCSAPDTVYMKQDRVTLLKCQACGATRPVKL
jgi:translation initiation factor 2 subunit 2